MGGTRKTTARKPSPRKAASAKPTAAGKPKTQVIHAGGHEIVADVPPPTPPEVVRCSVCGGVDCSHGKSSGWATKEG